MEGSLSLTTNFVLRTMLHLLHLIQQFKILPQKSWLPNMEYGGDISMQCVKDITDTSDTDQWTSPVLPLPRMGFVGKATQTF